MVIEKWRFWRHEKKKEEKRKSWIKQLKLILKKARYNRGTHQDSSYNSYQGAGSWKESEGWKSLSLQKTQQCTVRQATLTLSSSQICKETLV